MTFEPMKTWSGETWRWIAALFVSIITGAVSATWAGASYKHATDMAIERVADSVLVGERSNQQAHVALLKELDSQVGKQELRNDAVNRRLAELEAQAKINQAVIANLEALRTEVRYLSQGMTELKQELRDKRN